MSNKNYKSDHKTCLICGHSEELPKKLANHIKSAHKLKSIDYTIKHILKGVDPKCPECGVQPRYTSFMFKTYCRDHSSIAESKGGAKGGKIKITHNKGKTKETYEVEMRHSLSITGEKNHFFGKQHTEETKTSIANSKRLSEEEFNNRVSAMPNRFLCLSRYEDYQYRQGQKLLFKCQECSTVGRNTVVEHTLSNFERNPICKICHPGGSKEQLEIADFIKSFGFNIEYNDRKAIAPKELDIYVPEKKFAVEYNSFYYHSFSDEDKREDRHLEKTRLCESAGIDLIHIFQDEWLYKKEIVKSMIAYRLGKAKHRIYARDCTIKQLDSRTCRAFFDNNHIAGYSRAGIVALGLFYKNELVSAMSLRKPFMQQKYIDKAEMARFASKINTVVIGGLAKLLKSALKICKKLNYNGILTYADLRYGRGKGYEKVGFKSIGWTGLSYDYTDGTKRYSRFKFRANKQFQLSEAEVAINAGVNKIYGCGSNRFLFNII